MGMVIHWPGRVHARTSARSRAARLVKSSGLSDARRARSVANSSAQYSGGIQFLWNHLETWVAETFRNSAAMAILEPCDVPQSAMISWNEDGVSVMPTLLGQSVLNCKADVSLDWGFRRGQNVRMAETETEAQYKSAFIARVKTARMARNFKQWQLAEALGMPQDKYKQYETRSLLPHHLIGRFCIITHVEPEWLLTGRGEKGLRPIEVVETEKSAPRIVKQRKTSRKVA